MHFTVASTSPNYLVSADECAVAPPQRKRSTGHVSSGRAANETDGMAWLFTGTLQVDAPNIQIKLNDCKS